MQRRTLRAGLVAEFESANEIIRAAHELRKLGYKKMDAFTPYPLASLERAIGLRRSALGWVIFPFAVAGGTLAYLLQWWTSAVNYPLDVGGRPAHAAPAFVPIWFELTVLSSGLTAIVSLIIFSGLPALWQPVFEIEGFERASIDRFFLAISTRDPIFDRDATSAHLSEVGALRVEALGLPRVEEGEEAV